MTAFLQREDESGGLDQLDLTDSSIITFSNSLLDLTLSFEGKGTGVGSLAFDQVQVITFAPQVSEVGELDKYGINFTSKDRQHVVVAKDRDQFSCRGWSRIQGDRDVWVEHDLRVNRDAVDLFIAFESFSSMPLILSECFFVACESVLVDQRMVRKGVLERVRGTPRTLEWISDKEHVKVYLESKMTCQVIPLAGEGCFWGADFMISLQPEDISKRIHIQIVRTAL